MEKNETRMFQTADPKMKKILHMAENIAPSKATVLIQGESGVGKELLARFIHVKSPRAGRKFVAINCAAVPDGLLESELFGYEKGAFTGAEQRKLGRFEIAHDSTFLLDEISEMPLLLQAKILRVIQEGELERLGGQGSLKVNVRILATTNRDLSLMVKKKKFREDLYYRLNVVPLHLPPLRVRPKDIELLAHQFAENFCKENKKPLKFIAPEAMKKLLSWSWPGNVRELQNVMERSLLLSTGEYLRPDDIWIENFFAPPPEVSPLRAGMTMGEAEKWLILKTLELTEQNRTQAAQILDISIRTLRNKMSLYKNQEENK